MKLLYLFLILLSTLHAENNEMPFQLKSITAIENQKIVLSRKGTELYSLGEFGKFTVWSLSPFKKINEFHIENATNFELSTDENSLIITTVKQGIDHNGYPFNSDISLILWNIDTKQKQKDVKFLTPIHDMLLEKNLYLITKDTLEEWDVYKLEKIKKADLNITRALINQCNWLNHNEPVRLAPYKIVISPDRTKLLILFLEDILVIDIKTFTILKILADTVVTPYFWEDENVLNYGGKYKMDLRSLEVRKYLNDSIKDK